MAGLATALGKLVHLGVRRTPTRSTLAYANAHRPWQVYETLFYQVLTRCQAVAASEATAIPVQASAADPGYDDHRVVCHGVRLGSVSVRTKGAIKLHLQLDHQGCLPCWALVTEGDVNDVRVAQRLTFAPGTIVAIDRGYLDYALYQRWTTTGVWFVTRPRTNMLYEVLDQRPVPTRGPCSPMR